MVGLRAPWGTEGGVETAVGALAPRLVARGCAVRVFCRPRYNPLGSGVHEGVELVDVPTVYGRGLEAFVHTALAMPRALDADVVHIHATGPALFSALPRLARRATVVTVHGLDWQRAKWGPLARSVLRLGAWSSARIPHARIVVGQHLLQHYAETYGVGARWIPNGVEPVAEVPLEEADVDGLTSGDFALFLGRLVPEKGLETLFAAWAAAPTDLPLVVVGGGPDSDAYRSHLETLAPPGVRLVGSRTGRARDALLSHARALVSASELEGFPLVPLESLSAGRPVWLSDIAPHRELLRGEAAGAGRLVPAGAWPEAIAQLAGMDPGELDGMGLVGQDHVARAYSWDRVADDTLALYEGLLALRG